MRHRQTVPLQWLILQDREGIARLGELPRGSGILLLTELSGRDVRWLRHFARQRDLSIVREERGGAERVHGMRELRRALQTRTPLILLSPIYPTSSHPDWKRIPRMRAAALARLGGRRLLALGGMNARRFARIKGLGFQGWAGISAFRT
ncbi:MAG TPA: thiamine phosphate synthase [Sphingomicrobium sp.]